MHSHLLPDLHFYWKQHEYRSCEYPEVACNTALNMHELVFGEQVFIAQPEKNLRHSDYIPFAVIDYAFQVVLLIIHVPDHAAVDILFGGRHS